MVSGTNKKLVDIIHEALFVTDMESFQKLVFSVQNIFDFSHVYCLYLPSYNDKVISNKKSLYELVAMNFPHEFLENYLGKGGFTKDPVAYECLMSQDVERWSTSYKKYENYCGDVPIFDYNLTDGYTLVCPVGSGNISFSFAVDTAKKQTIIAEKHTKEMIALLTPHLGEALKRCLGYKKINALHLQNLLSSREIEILLRVKEGKTAMEIASSMAKSTSSRTIECHIANIKKKLNARNMPQAVAIACSMGL